ncbi:unnamed protein product [Vitrella brassicaformis CCMP3155]|uniref:Uncharacterized protein n=2 Tax=Vitrella brassicaformis TaxID=1169539 RepID=A0A0G4H601_VITBC|nr:unnamed protein product [Vitrella brassicaformis CCMP3155]|eukprot:CEM39275.1 unnamed protein product [Vitrella brassicaformis CCMP3155]
MAPLIQCAEQGRDVIDVKRTRGGARGAAGGGGCGGVESDEERQRREEREQNLRQQITDTEGLLSYMMAFLPINLMVQLARSIWPHAAPHLSDVTISSATKEERSSKEERLFWQHVHLAFVTQLAARLTRLTSITLRYPLGPSRFTWCFDVFVAIIDIAGRRAANLTEGTLQTITIQGVRLTGTARLSRTHPRLPAPLDPPPTLDALTTITGLTLWHDGLANRSWRMPSLATAKQRNWDADRLGQFISSSRSLRCVDGRFADEEWADVFERIPATPVGQQGGPLAQLESIGTIVVREDNPAGIDRLEKVLVARGCRRSLKELHVDRSVDYAAAAGHDASISRPTLPVLLALDRMVGACCLPNAPLTVTNLTGFRFDLSIFYHDVFATHPSPSLKSMIQQLAEQATGVYYVFTQDGITDPHSDPSPSAIDIASSLSFDKATHVEVERAPGFHPPANTPPPHPAIISHLKPFPEASELDVRSRLGGAAARLFTSKMPKKVGRVDIRRVSGAEEKVGVLTDLGRDREVGTVSVGDIGVAQLVGAANELPTIRELDFELTLPDGVQDAGIFVRTSLSSAIPHIRGLRRVGLTVDDTTAEQHASIEASLPDGANNVIEGFTIRHEHRGPDFTVVTEVRNA